MTKMAIQNVLVSTNGKLRLRIRRTTGWDEWQVVWLENVTGVFHRNEAKTYYTDDLEDAVQTRETMLQIYEETGE